MPAPLPLPRVASVRRVGPVARAMFALYALAIIVATGYPFRFAVPPYFIQSRRPAPAWDVQDGMVFAGLGMFTKAGNRPVDLAKITEAGTYYVYVEAWPAATRTAYPAPLVTCAPAGIEFGVTLAQDRADLIVRVPVLVNVPYELDLQEVRFAGVFASAGWHSILLLDDGAHLRVWTDGTAHPPIDRQPLRGDFWGNGSFIAAGNELLGRYGWRGRIRRIEIGAGPPPAGVRVAARAVLDTPGATPTAPLFVVDAARRARPRHWESRTADIWNRRPAPPWALRPFRNRRWTDASLNLLLFLPFGALARWRWHAIGGAMLAGVLLSLAVESVQVFLPARVCDITDVLMNSIGGACGALLATALAHRWNARTPA